MEESSEREQERKGREGGVSVVEDAEKRGSSFRHEATAPSTRDLPS